MVLIYSKKKKNIYIYIYTHTHVALHSGYITISQVTRSFSPELFLFLLRKSRTDSLRRLGSTGRLVTYYVALTSLSPHPHLPLYSPVACRHSMKSLTLTIDCVCFQQTSDLDTLLCRQDLDRLRKLDDDDPDKSTTETTGMQHMEDFFEGGGPACRPQASFVSSRSQPAGNDDDVFLRPPLWEDITSSIQKLDPANADMLGSQSHVKMETEDITSPVLSPVEIKTEPLPPAPTLHLLEGRTTNNSLQNFNNRLQNSNDNSIVHHSRNTGIKGFSANNNNNHINNNNINETGSNHHGTSHQVSGNGTSPLYGSMTRLMYVSPLTPPISDPGSPLGGPPRRTPPPPYPQPQIMNPPHRIQQSSMTKFNRRNNPELEKRRVHHCDFIGENIPFFEVKCSRGFSNFFFFIARRKKFKNFRRVLDKNYCNFVAFSQEKLAQNVGVIFPAIFLFV